MEGPTQPKPPGSNSTHWSVIVRAQGVGPEARAALGDLIKRYEPAVIAMIRARPHPKNTSPEELKQQFFLDFLKRQDILKLDPNRGHFRAWLRTAVRNFMKNVWARFWSEKHGESTTGVFVFEVSHQVTPEAVFDHQYAVDTVLHALDRQRHQTRHPERFERLLPFLPGPQLNLVPQSPVAKELGMSDVGLRQVLLKLRKEYEDALREVVAETLDADPVSPEGRQAVDLEMRLLYRALCELPPTDVHLADT